MRRDPERRKFLKSGVEALLAGVAMSGCTLGGSSQLKSITDQVAHRPWPLPERRWLLYMRWHDLVFLHWPVRPEAIRPLIPKSVELDTYEGWCWIGVVPFHMSGVRLRYLPIQFAFPELNVRTYVKTSGRSGVWFFSLDATNRLAVRAARWMGLPYYDARMTVEVQGERVSYDSARTHTDAPTAEFNATYGSTGPVYQAAAGTLDHWLTERYALYAALEPDEVVYGEIHHAQWPLQPADAELRVNTMFKPLGIALGGIKPLCHFARYQEVVAWTIVRLNRAPEIYWVTG
jgi:uncharacterized protein